MKALFFSGDRQIFEEGSSVRARFRAYASAIGEVHVACVAPHAKRAQDGSLFLHPLRGSRLFAASALRALIRTHNIEVISAQDPFEYGLVAWQAARGTRAKLHIQVHTDFLSLWFLRAGGFRSPRVPAPILNHVRRLIADFVLPKAAGVRAVSVRVAQSLKGRYGSQVATPSVIPVSVTVAGTPPVPLPAHTASFMLITVGRLEPEKRIEDILYAIARIRFSYPAIGLTIVGSGSEEPRLRALTRRLGLSKHVLFLGARSDAYGLMKSAQAYIQASAYEGYGRTLIEAALARIPIITTDVGIVGEVFEGYRDVLAAPIADPAALAVHIRGLLDDHQARIKLVMSAEEAARNHLAAVGDPANAVAADLRSLTQTV